MRTIIMTAEDKFNTLNLFKISTSNGPIYDVRHQRWIPEIVSYDTEVDMNLEYEDALHLFAVIVNKHGLEIL